MMERLSIHYAAREMIWTIEPVVLTIASPLTTIRWPQQNLYCRP